MIILLNFLSGISLELLTKAVLMRNHKICFIKDRGKGGEQINREAPFWKKSKEAKRKSRKLFVSLCKMVAKYVSELIHINHGSIKLYELYLPCHIKHVHFPWLLSMCLQNLSSYLYVPLLFLENAETKK